MLNRVLLIIILAVIIDVHTHIFSPEISSRRDYYCSNDACFNLLYGDHVAKLRGVEDLLQSMDANGIDISVVQNIGWTSHDLCCRSNDYIIESILKYPGRLIGFCSIQPREPEKAIAEMDRCFKHGIRGVGELRPDVQGFDLDNSDLLDPLVDFIKKNNAVFSIHASEPVGHEYKGKGNVTPGRLYTFVKHYPDLQIILAHFGGGLPFYELMPEVRSILGNVYYDTAAAPFLYGPGVYTTVNGICGSRKLLYGTDWPLLDQSRVLLHIASGSLSQADSKAILYQNAVHLFQLEKRE